ncbi:MAG: 3-hydroxyacyl-[acyl-carrier-protein] dehydratase FabZ, partial [Pseudomonadota bacterium]|nr:3-hydroxyacyl-[acyl-carrier-protein] dehydratase FabZ [Pseudomonadota bacterium]
TPGDSLYIEVTKVRSRGMVWKFTGEAKVDGKVVAEATFSAMIRG